VRRLIYWFRWVIALPISVFLAALAYLDSKVALLRGGLPYEMDITARILIAHGISGALGGALFVSCASLIAPSHKQHAANVALAAGMTFVTYMLCIQPYREGWWWNAYLWFTASLSMAAVAFGVNRWSRRQGSNHEAG
jgi:hypothetical protein